MGKRRRKNIYYIVKAHDALSSWVTQELNDAYKHALYLSKLEETVVLQEVTEKEILTFKNGKVVIDE